VREILVVGSAGYDTITTPKGHVENVLGGSSNYFSYAASLYAKVNYVGVVGRDFRQEDIDDLLKRGVDLEGLQRVDGETFRWAGRYDGHMNEATTLATYLNVLGNFSPVLPAKYRKSTYVFLANIDPVLQMRVLDQVESPWVVGLDTMNFWIDSKIADLHAAIKRVGCLLLNEKEAEKLSGETNILKSIRKLASMGPKVVVIKRGEYGFVLCAEGRLFIGPAFPVEEVIDPTGAGDTFAGGFFGYLSKLSHAPKFRDFQEAAVHGAVVASFTVEDFALRGLQKLDSTQVDRRLSEYLKTVTFQS
jgi:sugar/nucleoside kinase (ribokinase family)